MLNTQIGQLNSTQKTTLAGRGIVLPYSTFPATQTLFQSLLPYPQYTGNISPSGSPQGKTWYDSLQTTVTQRLAHGLTLNGNFTWSKNLSLMSSPDIYNRILGKNLAAFDLPLIEDAAQAFGAPAVARTGIASTYSFYPTKNLFALGDGGLVAVNDEELGERLRLLRFHGSKAKVTFELVGYNSRLDEIHAAALRVFLPHLDEWTVLRREAAERYRELGLGDLVRTPEDEPGHVYHLFVSRSSERDRIVEALREAEIGCATYYLPPLHLQPALAYLGYREGSLPETEKLARENFSVPLWGGIGSEQQERVVSVVRSTVGAAVA
jgi:hypothetical protein